MSFETADAASAASPRSSSERRSRGLPRTPPRALISSTASSAPFFPDCANVAVGPVSAPKNPSWMPWLSGLFSPPHEIGSAAARAATKAKTKAQRRTAEDYRVRGPEGATSVSGLTTLIFCAARGSAHDQRQDLRRHHHRFGSRRIRRRHPRLAARHVGSDRREGGAPGRRVHAGGLHSHE